MNTARVTIEIKKEEGSIDDLEAWEKLLEILETLTAQGMSSEDEDQIELDQEFQFFIPVYRN